VREGGSLHTIVLVPLSILEIAISIVDMSYLGVDVFIHLFVIASLDFCQQAWDVTAHHLGFKTAILFGMRFGIVGFVHFVQDVVLDIR
jgi:hypothetical protein